MVGWGKVQGRWMRKLHLLVVGIILPALLAACQNTQSSSNGYGVALVNQSLDVKKQFETLAASNAATSSATKKQVAKTAPVAPVATETAAAAETKAPTKVAAQKLDPIAQQAVVALAQPVKKTTEVEPIVKRKLTPQQRLAARRELYHPIVAKHARASGVPVELALAVVEVESNYRPKARGRAGEIGLMQLLPRTARYIGYEGSMKKLYHPDTNIRYGMKCLGKAYRLGGGSTCGTILKYNAGHAAKKMNKISRHYCERVRQIMQQT